MGMGESISSKLINLLRSGMQILDLFLFHKSQNTAIWADSWRFLQTNKQMLFLLENADKNACFGLSLNF